jgi:pilus assembly protein CpaE
MSTAGGPTDKPRVLVVDRTGELAARIRHNVVGAGAAVKSCPDTARAEEHLAAGGWDVVVAGPSLMHRAGLRRLGSLHQRFPWVSLVLALHERPRADLAEIIQVGADDLVPLHANDGELTRALARAARITRGRLGVAADAGGRGRIITVCSASGGCGKTFLATNAAEFLARTTDEPVVLVDLDLQFGEVSTALRLRPDVTITDALAVEAEGHDLDEILDDYLLTHPDGFKVLAAPRLPGEADSVTPGDVTRILDVLRARRAWVVIDTHEGLSDLFVAALEATDHVFAVATPDRPSLVNLGRYLSALEGLGVAGGNISVVLNKAETDTGLEAVDMAAQLGRRFEAMVPYSRDVSRSINVGVPLIVGDPKSPVSALLTTALSVVLPAGDPPAPATATTARSRLSRRPKTQPQMAVPSAPVAAPTPAPAPTTSPPAPPVPVIAASAAVPPSVRVGHEPLPVVPDATPPNEESRDNERAPIDLSLPRYRHRSATEPARHGGRCRRSPERLIGGPCRGRAPPRPRLAYEPHQTSRRAEVRILEMRAPPAAVALFLGGFASPVRPPPHARSRG